MLVLVNMNNQGRPFGGVALDRIRALGVQGIRTDIVPDCADEQLREFCDNPDLQLLALIHGGKMPGNEETLLREAKHAATVAKNLRMHELPKRPIFELGNEPTVGDVGKTWKNPENFGRAVAAAATRVWEIMGQDTLVVSGGVHNPGEKCQDYLERAARYFPRNWGHFAVGFHNYAPGMGDPDKPHKGFETLDQQIARLRKLGFPLFDTESGGHTGPNEKHTDEQIAQWLTRRLELSRSWGLLGTVVYQFDDGPNPMDHEDCFGLFRHPGREWKLSAYALKETMEKWRAETVADQLPATPELPAQPPLPAETEVIAEPVSDRPRRKRRR